jgi:hypothetical protein
MADGNQDMTLAYDATFTLIQAASTSVPEPFTLTLFGAVLLRGYRQPI